MPAIDQCESQVVNALQKQRWIITHQPFAIRIDSRRAGYIYADLRLRHRQNSTTIIIVEVKCFNSTRTFLDELYQAIGQYVTYRTALAQNDLHTPVYLAVPSNVYDSFFQTPLVHAVLKDIQVRLIVIDLEKEEVIQWIP